MRRKVALVIAAILGVALISLIVCLLVCKYICWPQQGMHKHNTITEREVYKEPKAEVYKEPGVVVYKEPKAEVYKEPGVVVYKEPKAEGYEEPGVAVYKEPKAEVYEELPLLEICAVIIEKIKKGIDIKEIVKTSIQMGHSPCLVIKCAIDGGGSFEQVIAGAIEAGTTSDVVSRCAVNAGAEPKDIAGVLEREELTGIGYIPPLTAEPVSIAVGLPGGGTGGGFLSPSSF